MYKYFFPWDDIIINGKKFLSMHSYRIRVGIVDAISALAKENKVVLTTEKIVTAKKGA